MMRQEFPILWRDRTRRKDFLSCDGWRERTRRKDFLSCSGWRERTRHKDFCIL